MSGLSDIMDRINEINTVFVDATKTNDKRLEELAKGNEARANELQQTLDKQNSAITALTKQRDEMHRDMVQMKERVEIAEALIDRPKGTPEERLDNEHKTTFFNALRKGFQDSELNGKLRLLESKTLLGKDVTIGSSIGGGYGLPKEIGDRIDKLILALSAVVGEVRQVQVGTSDYQELVSIFGGTSSWISETGSRTASGTPNLRNCKPTWGELYSYPQVSEWALQDIFFDVAGWLTGDVADGMSKNLATAIWSGSGSNQPTGMTNTAPVSTADSASPMRAAAAYQFVALLSAPSPLRINMDSIINLVYTLKPGYRGTAKFAMNSTVQGAVRTLKSTQGIYYWEPSQQAGQPDLLLGYPVFTWEDMSNNVAAGTPVAFGAFNRAYLLVNRVGLNITQDNISLPGYVKFYVRRRWGGIPLNNDAVKFLKNA